MKKSKYLDFFIRIRQIVIYQEIIKVLKMTNITLPNDWQWKKLGEMLDVRDGTHDSPKYLTENGYPFVTSKNLKENGLDLENVNLISESDYFNFNKRSKVDKGDLLLAMIGTIGNPIIVEIEPNFAIKNVALIKANENVVMMKFLKFFFTSQATINKMQDESNGATQKFVSLKYLRNFPIPLPPLEEQKRIVAKIDAAFEQLDEAISLQKNNILRTETLKKALLVDVFEGLHGKFEISKLSTFGKITSGGTPSRQIKEYWDGDIEWFSSGELNTTMVFESKDKITQLGLSNSNAKVFPTGTLLIGMYDTAAMKMSILGKEAACNQAIVGIIPPPDKLNTYFLKFQLEYLKSEILLQRQGVRQQNLNAQKIKDIEISLPPISEQEKIVAYLDKSFAEIDKMLEAQKTRLAHLEDMKKAILQEAFEGKL